MARYIDADKFERDIVSLPYGYRGMVRSILSEQSTADVVEVKHGKWLKQNPLVDTEECSLCKYNIYSEELETPFCPWCGARMESE